MRWCGWLQICQDCVKGHIHEETPSTQLFCYYFVWAVLESLYTIYHVKTQGTKPISETIDDLNGWTKFLNIGITIITLDRENNIATLSSQWCEIHQVIDILPSFLPIYFTDNRNEIQNECSTYKNFAHNNQYRWKVPEIVLISPFVPVTNLLLRQPYL